MFRPRIYFSPDNNDDGGMIDDDGFLDNDAFFESLNGGIPEKTVEPETEEVPEPEEEAPADTIEGEPTEPEEEEPVSPAEEEEPESEPESEDPAEEEPESEEEDEFVDISELTGGRIENIDDIPAMLDELEALRNQPKDPQFKNDTQKNLYNLLSKYDGDPTSQFENYLSIDKLNLETIQPKDALWHAFRMDSQYNDFTEDEKKIYFENQYETKYGDLEDNPIKAMEQKVEFGKAKRQLETLQNEFRETKADEVTPETTADQLLDIKRNTRETFGNQKSLSISGKVKGKDSDIPFDINLPISQKDKDYVVNAMTDIRSTWNDILTENGAIKEDGNVDYGKYASIIHRLKNMSQIDAAIYDQARKDFEIAMRKKQSEQKPASVTSKSSDPVGAGKKVKSDQEELSEGFSKAFG